MDQYNYTDNSDLLLQSQHELHIKSDLDDGTRNQTFRVKNYVAQKLNKKYLTLPYIIGSLIIICILTLALIIQTNSCTKDVIQHPHHYNNSTVVSEVLDTTTLRNEIIPDKTTNAVENHTKKSSEMTTPTEVLIGMKNNIFKLNLGKSTFLLRSLLFEVNGSIDALEKYKDSIYWIDRKSAKIMFVLEKNGSNETQSILFEEPRVKPYDMAIDQDTGNLYFIDNSIGALIVVNIMTRNYSLLSMDLEEPSEIILDSSEGLLFVLEHEHLIVKFRMDGLKLDTLLVGEHPYSRISSISLDVSEKRLYWTNDSMGIQRSDYDGKNITMVKESTAELSNLIKVEDHLYWSQQLERQAHVYTKHMEIKSCKIVQGICDSIVNSLQDSLHNQVLEDYVISKYSSTNRVNKACEINNGGCQHLCLLIPNGRSCACHMGWQLNNDSTSCSKVQDFILYTMDNKVRARILDITKITSVDVIWPTPCKTKVLHSPDTVIFDYDWENDNFYFIDMKHIFKMKLQNYRNQSIILSSTDIRFNFIDMAYDWLSKNIYYSTVSTVSWYLKVYNSQLGNDFQKTVGVHGSEKLIVPYDIVLYPSKGFIFYISQLDDNKSIQKAYLNGSELMKIGRVDRGITNKLIAIDYQENKLYWVLNITHPVIIKYADLNGLGEKTISVDSWPFGDIKSLYVHEKWLYLSTSGLIFRMNKYTGKEIAKVLPGNPSTTLNRIYDEHRSIDGLKVVSAGLQSRTEENTCATNNGGCKEFCFYGAVKNCGCKDNSILQTDGTCS